MNHAATVCTHCGDGCKTTLGVRSVSDGSEIVRGDNRDKSGMNGDFLCNKGRYAFDFANNIERLTSPLVRKNGKLTPVSWDEALIFAGTRLRDLRQEHGPNSIEIGRDYNSAIVLKAAGMSVLKPVELPHEGSLEAGISRL